MAQGDVIIGGVDVFTQYGAYPVLNGLAGVVGWPAPKKIEATSWFEENGEDLDLSQIILGGTKFNVSFGLSGDKGTALDFYSFIGNNTRNTWKMPAIGLQMPLRVLSMSGVEMQGGLYSVSAQVANDNLWDGLRIVNGAVASSWSYPDPFVPVLPTNNDYTLGDRPLSDYGVQVGGGSLVSFQRGGSVKKVLERDISTVNGIIGDFDGQNHFDSSDIVLNCTIVSNNTRRALIYYYALLHDLVSPSSLALPTRECAKTLTVGSSGVSYPCYYKGQSVKSLTMLTGGGLWIDFTLTLGRVNIYV